MADEKQTPDDNWVHRSKSMRCKTCMWWVQKRRQIKTYDPVWDRDTFDSGIGRCRRHAPTMTGYPVVVEDDWCGDHKLDVEKV